MIPPCLTLSNIRYISKVKWSNREKGVAPSSTPPCSGYWKVANFTLFTSLYLHEWMCFWWVFFFFCIKFYCFKYYHQIQYITIVSVVSWGHGICRLHLCRGVKPPPTSVLDMALDHLMAQLHSLRFGRYSVPVRWYLSQV